MSDQVTISKRTLVVVAAVVAAVLVAVGAFFAISAVARAAEESAAAEADAAALQERHSNLFRDAIRACAKIDGWGAGAYVRDGGLSLELNGTGGGWVAGAQFEHQSCVLRKVGAPDSVLGRMQNTRALDGTQEAEWDDLIARWTYHPDNGLDVFVEFVG